VKHAKHLRWDVVEYPKVTVRILHTRARSYRGLNVTRALDFAVKLSEMVYGKVCKCPMCGFEFKVDGRVFEVRIYPVPHIYDAPYWTARVTCPLCGHEMRAFEAIKNLK